MRSSNDALLATLARHAELAQLCALADSAPARAALHAADSVRRVTAAAAAASAARASEHDAALRGPPVRPPDPFTAHPAQSIPRAAERFLSRPECLSDLMLYVTETARALRVPIPRPPAVPLSLSLARTAVLHTAQALAATPQRDTLGALMCAIASYDRALSNNVRKLPSRPAFIGPTREHLSEPDPAPRPFRVPENALDWQTNPLIGLPPPVVHEIDEARKIYLAQRRVESRAQLRELEAATMPRALRKFHRPLPAPEPRALPPMGRPTLSLPRLNERKLDALIAKYKR